MRNRPQVLDLSPLLLLARSSKPNTMIIVDPSDDPEAIANVVKTDSARSESSIRRSFHNQDTIASIDCGTRLNTSA